MVALLGGAAALTFYVKPGVAQSSSRVWRIGYLSTRACPNELSDSLVKGLRELGYVEHTNLLVELRGAAGKNDHLSALAAELVDANVDLIATEGTPATQAALRATTLIPIVFGSAQDPVEKGLVASLAHPGGNATGTALVADQSKHLALLKEAVPTISQVVFLYDPATRPGAYGESSLKMLRDHAARLGVRVHPVTLRDADETERLFTTFPAATDGLVVENSAINLVAQDRICRLATERRLPAVGTFGSFTSAGCLMSYGENLPAVYRRAAAYVDKILRGSKPSDLPVMQATTFELAINLKAAKAIGLEVSPALLARADEVIE